jgi:plasmid stabilization system protein ParE
MSDHKVYKLQFSRLAFNDLYQIQTYTELTFGAEQGYIYESKLKEGFSAISNMPSIVHPH